MNFISVGKENSTSINLYYEDHGTGKPVVLIHGWPLSGASWERQVPALVNAGHRVITYDRRGFGKSSQPLDGYDYDTLAADLHTIMVELEVHDATLVGFSMGGGEVARYLGKYGHDRVSKAVFMASITPFLLKTPDNPGGQDASHFTVTQKAVAADRPAFLTGFFSKFFNTDVLLGERISEEVIRLNWNIAAGASPKGTHDCVQSWPTDFRDDLATIKIPTLIVHGDSDRILPIAGTGQRAHDAVKGSKLVVIKGGPHGINWTHADDVNDALLEFLGSGHSEQSHAATIADVSELSVGQGMRTL